MRRETTDSPDDMLRRFFNQQPRGRGRTVPRDDDGADRRGNGIHHRQGRFHPHEQPRRRGSRRDPGGTLRRQHVEPQRASLPREGDRARHADRQRAHPAHGAAGDAAAGGPLRRLRSDAAWRLGHGDRQSVQSEPHRDRRSRLGARPSVLPRHRPPAEHDPDRRGDQSRQLGRAAPERPRRGRRHEHGDLYGSARGEHRHRLRDAHQRDSRDSCRSCEPARSPAA